MTPTSSSSRRRALLVGLGPTGVEGAQLAGFEMHRRDLRRALGLGLSRVDNVPLHDLTRAVLESGADFAFIMARWSDPAGELRAALERIHADPRRPTTIFIDYVAPSTTPFFHVLPLVDLYLKRQGLRDIGAYQRPYRGGHVFADWYSTRYGYDLGAWAFGSTPDPALTHKISAAWNLAVSPASVRQLRIAWLIAPRLSRRPIDLNVRFGAGKITGAREWYHDYRERALDTARRLGDSMRLTPPTRIDRRLYFLELCRSKMTLSPFGWGELCYRDFEAACAGSVLLKPSMDHLETSPSVYAPFETYIPLEWDLSDLEEKARWCLSNPAEAQRIANNAREVMRRYFREKRFVSEIARALEAAQRLRAGSPVGAALRA